MILFVLVVIAISAGIVWIPIRHLSAVASDGRKALYYTCAMHPWVRESKPGQCPVCGMNLTPIFANESGVTDSNANANSGMVTLESESISTINVQTEMATNRPVRRTLHLSGEIVGNSSSSAWFEFTAYERDLQWLKVGQTFNVIVSSTPGKIYHAQIKLHGVKPFADANFDMMSGSTTVRAQILNPPVEAGDFGKNKLFNGLHAEAHVVAETEEVLVERRDVALGDDRLGSDRLASRCYH